MVLEPVHCPNCDSIDVVRHGKTAAGKQRGSVAKKLRSTICGVET
jgi:hypothetical protein